MSSLLNVQGVMLWSGQNLKDTTESGWKQTPIPYGFGSHIDLAMVPRILLKRDLAVDWFLRNTANGILKPLRDRRAPALNF